VPKFTNAAALRRASGVLSLSASVLLHKNRNKKAPITVFESMSAFPVSRRPWLFLGGFLGLVVVCSVAVHPFGSVKQSDGGRMNVDDLAMPLEVKTLLQRSCKDCHSNQTIWPWYSYVAPGSWLVETDVRRGRDHMNLSNWPQYSFKQKEKLLADIASVVKNHEMPLPQYTLIHPGAKLSDADADILYQWARLERRKLKVALSASALPPERTVGPAAASITLKRSGKSGR
jgi:hypothetical protein